MARGARANPNEEQRAEVSQSHAASVHLARPHGGGDVHDSLTCVTRFA